MKKKYRTPKVINMAEKIDAALVHGVLTFVFRSLAKANTGLTPDGNAPKILQTKENS